MRKKLGLLQEGYKLFSRMGEKAQIWLAAGDSTICEKSLDKPGKIVYYIKAVTTYAAIAQSVERILGKDEVASSNLASSSNKRAHPTGWALLLNLRTGRTGDLIRSVGASRQYFKPRS